MNRQLAARAEAAVWITRLHAPDRNSEMEAGFHQWLNESAQNRLEFEELTDIWAAAGVTRRSRARNGLRFAAAAACVLAVIAGAAWQLQYRIGHSYSTDIGEQRLLQLADESRIWMNAETRARVMFGPHRRQVELIRGEAFFEVAQDARRPFVVLAGGHSVTALGTSFVVRYESTHTDVTLVEGKVAVGASPWVLAAGQRLTFASASEPKLDEPPVESVLAWRRGEVVLNDTPLREAVTEMNHYDKATIIIDSPAIATLNVSGLYHTGDNLGFARSMAKFHHLDLQERDGRLHLKTR